MTILEVIQRSQEFLARKGVDSPRLQIELLLAQVLQMPRMKLYLNFERALTETEVEQVRELVKRRGNREPLQHLVGSTSFCGYEMKVTPDVLVPRPETELLAECAWTYLQSLGGTPLALDFGTGSGCLAITIATKCPAATLHAVDISAPALAIARSNAAQHQVAPRVVFHHSDGFKSLPAGLAFALIVGNPPYIPVAEISTLDPEVRDHDPRLALDGGTDGLEFYRLLAREGAAWLRPDGKIMLEFGDEQGPAITEIFAAAGWSVESLVKDYSGRERFCIAQRR